MSGRYAVLVTMIAALSCRPARVQPVDQADTATSFAATGDDTPAVFNGTWIGGSSGEPDTRVITWQLPCRVHPASWVLEQRRDTVRSYHFPEQYEQGVASREPMVASTGTIGRVRRDTLYLVEGKDRYALHYDSTSGHLRGTLNGQPFWAAQRIVTRAQVCPAVP